MANGLIQRFPAALLPLLSIKATETPPELGSVVQPGLDMWPAYLAERLEVQATSTAAVSAPTTLTLTVPSGEYWWLYSVSTSAFTITAGSVISLAVGVGDATGANAYLGSTPLTAATIATQSVVCAASQGLPLLLKPGMRIIGQLLADPGVGVTDLDLKALVARLSPS